MKKPTTQKAQKALIKFLKSYAGLSTEEALDEVNTYDKKITYHRDGKGFAVTESAMRGLNRAHYRFNNTKIGLEEVGWEYKNTRGDNDGKWMEQEPGSMAKMEKIRLQWNS